jgi:hypothetical protein
MFWQICRNMAGVNFVAYTGFVGAKSEIIHIE